MEYRREIDGLRAVAVLVVVLFHAGVPGFAGGYIGVDVFFVISGYLITSILVHDLERGRFSILRFYERRARRLLPALLAVLAVATALAWALLLPQQRESFSEALLAVGLFCSNVYFWRQSNYFAPVAEENPLLHTWSLAVEEQFYLVFPLALLVLWPLGRGWIFRLVIGTSLLSFAMAEAASSAFPAANFFLIPSRAWELGAGALCAMTLGLRSPAPTRRADTAAAIGMVLVLASVFAFDDETPFPSLLAGLPVGGTVLIVLGAHANGGVGRLLSSPAVVHVGLISYSLYLWHQPLLAFARLTTDGALSALQLLGALVGALVLAEISWRYVEQPFRSQAARPISRRAIFVGAGVGLGCVLIVGATGLATSGGLKLWERNHPDLAKAYALVADARSGRGKTFDDKACRFNTEHLDEEAVQRVRACAATHGEGVLVIGDSHSIDIFAGLYATTDLPFLVGITSGGCRPHDPRSGCPYEDVAYLLEREPGVIGRVLFHQSGAYLMRLPTGETGRQIFRRLTSTSRLEPADYRPQADLIAKNNAYLVRLARYAETLWIGPRVEPHVSLETIVERGCDRPMALRPGLEAVFAQLDRAIDDLLAGGPVVYVSLQREAPMDFAEDFGRCDVIYWSDGDHWTPAGASRFVGRLVDARPSAARAP